MLIFPCFILYFLISAPTFDMPPIPGTNSCADSAPYNPEISIKAQPSRLWEIDVRCLVSTKKWLCNYGLKKNRLKMFHIMPQIGFRQSDGKSVSSYTKYHDIPIRSDLPNRSASIDTHQILHCV